MLVRPEVQKLEQRSYGELVQRVREQQATLKLTAISSNDSDQKLSAESAFVPTREGHWRVDLYALARQRLAIAGMTDVHGGGLDTIADARFFSHRRDQTTGRMATIAWIR